MLITSPFPPIPIPLISIHQLVFSNPFGINENTTVLVDGVTDKSLTYANVKSKAIRLGNSLRQKHEFASGDVLAVYSENQLYYSIVLLGTLAAGGTVTAANPSYTSDELLFQLVDSRAKYLVTTVLLLPKVLDAAKKANISRDRIFLFDEIGIDSFKTIYDLFNGTNETIYDDGLWSGDEVHRTAYLCYSSGTTGRPKGVELTHFNIVANILQRKGAWKNHISKDDVVMAVLPFYHTYALTQVLHYLTIIGAKSIILAKFTLPTFLSLIQKYRITYMPIVPPICLQISKSPLVKEYDISSVRLLTCAAAPLGKEIEDLLRTVMDRAIILQTYGLTESSPTSHVVPLEAIDSYPYGSVGVLLPNMDAKILDPDGKELGINEDGEILMRGPNIMKGYLNNEEATRNTVDSDGFLHTGDVGHVDERGYFFIVDRVKELIKYKGFQVAPAELESILNENPKIIDSAVIPLYSSSQATEIPLAFVVLAPGCRASPSLEKEIEIYVEKRVSPHKRLRGGVRFIDEIPKSPSGKILRRVLRNMTKETREGESKAKL